MSRSLTGTQTSRPPCSLTARLPVHQPAEGLRGGGAQEVVLLGLSEHRVFYSFISVLGLTGPRRTKESAGA